MANLVEPTAIGVSDRKGVLVGSTGPMRIGLSVLVGASGLTVDSRIVLLR